MRRKMIHQQGPSALKFTIYAGAGLTILLSLYFGLAAIQGDFGVLRRLQINAEAESLRQERDALAAELARMQNLTHRLSDAYLDLDLLDEQARTVLGYMRADEIVIR